MSARSQDAPSSEAAEPDWEDYLPGGYEDGEGVHNVGAPPYYGSDTRFYGEDAPGG